MALYRATIRSAAGGGSSPDAYKWSNIWYIEGTGVGTAAADAVSLWVTHLRPATNPYFYAYEVYISDLVPDTTVFGTYPIIPGEQRGTRGGFGNTALDWYNPAIVHRYDLTVAAGFSSRKWMRFGLTEASVAPGGLTMSDSDWQASITTAMGACTAEAFVRDESGNAFTGVLAKGLQPKRLGKFARYQLPTPPAFG